MKRVLLGALLLAACSPAADLEARDESGVSGNAVNASGYDRPVPSSASNAAHSPQPEDDGLGALEPYVAALKGRFELWQNDRGEDGWMCELELTGERTIGGYVVKAEEPCLKKINVEGLYAWFVAPDDGYLVFIDATRKPLMRLKPDENGVYFGSDAFYATRGGS